MEYNLKVIHQKLLVAESALVKRTNMNYTRARHEILSCIAGRHAYTLKSSACCEFLQAWRQLVFATLEHFNVLSEAEREAIIYDLLEVFHMFFYVLLCPVPALSVIPFFVFSGYFQSYRQGLLAKLRLDLQSSAMQVLAAAVLMLTQKLHQLWKLHQQRGEESRGLPVDRLCDIFCALNDGEYRVFFHSTFCSFLRGLSPYP